MQSGRIFLGRFVGSGRPLGALKPSKNVGGLRPPHFWMVLKPPVVAQTPKTDPQNSGQTAFRYPAFIKNDPMLRFWLWCPWPPWTSWPWPLRGPSGLVVVCLLGVVGGGCRLVWCLCRFCGLFCLRPLPANRAEMTCWSC